MRRLGFGVLVAAGAALALVPACALASAGDILVGGDDGSNTVLRIKPNGQHQIVAAGAPLTHPGGLDFTPKGTIFASDYGLPGLVKVNPVAHTAKSAISGSPFESATDVARGPDGQIYVVDSDLGTLFRVDPSTNTATPLSTSVPDAVGVTLDAKGNFLVAGAGVFEVNRETGLTTTVPGTPDTVSAFGIARSPSGAVYVDNSDDDSVEKLDPATGALKQVAIGGFLHNIYDMDIEPNGHLVIAADSTPHARIVQVNPKTGKQKVVPGGTLGDAAAEGVRVEPPSCGGKLATIVGSTKKDDLKGTKFNDIIAGLGGNDKIDGAGGNDVICGGEGGDKLAGGSGNDKLIGGGGHDDCSGGPGRDHDSSC